MPRGSIAMSSGRFISIMDTTLRDGEQTPGISFTPAQKLQIAERLDRLGVDVIESGFPVTSDGEATAVREIAASGLSSEVSCLARAEKRDVEIAANCGVGRVHVFIATSDIHLRDKLQISRDEMIRRARETVEFATELGLFVEFSAEDSTRTSLEDLHEVACAVRDAGARIFDIADTVGIASPDAIRSYVAGISDTGMAISVHCHDDLGLAVANSLAAVNAGASQVHVTVNGIGERAGNTSIEEFAIASELLYGFNTHVRKEMIYETCSFVSKVTGLPIPRNKAITGENAFGHKSGIHTHGISRNPMTYEPFRPELVGRKRWLQAGKHSGRHGISIQLRCMNISLKQEELDWVVKMVKQNGDQGKITTDEELQRLAFKAIQTSGVRGK